MNALNHSLNGREDISSRKSKEVNPDILLSELISAFNSMQKKSKKPKGKHIREI